MLGLRELVREMRVVEIVSARAGMGSQADEDQQQRPAL